MSTSQTTHYPHCPYCNTDLALHSKKAGYARVASMACPLCHRKIYGMKNITGTVKWFTYNPIFLVIIAIVGVTILIVAGLIVFWQSILEF